MIDPVCQGHSAGFHSDRHAEANGKQPKPYSENKQEQQRQPECRRTGNHQTVSLDCFIYQFPPVHTCHYTQKKAQDPGNHPGYGKYYKVP